MNKKAKQLQFMKSFSDEIDKTVQEMKLQQPQQSKIKSKKASIIQANMIGTASIVDSKSPARRLSKSQKKKAKKNLAITMAKEMLQNKSVETMVFNNPDATWKKVQASGETENFTVSLSTRSSTARTDSSTPGIEIDLKKVRYEIMKFGVANTSIDKKADAETALAISLGARPEKRVGINYKELIVNRKKEREEKEALEASMVKPKIKIGGSGGGKKSKTAVKADALKKTSNNIILKSKLRNQQGSTGIKSFGGGKRPDKRTRQAGKRR